MKPIERLGQRPSDPVIYHELGHVYVQKHFGRSCFINFLPGADTGAGTGSGWTKEAREFDRSISDLAGAYAQTVYCPTSVAMPLRQQLLEGTLFDDGRILSGETPEEAFFFRDDLGFVRTWALQNLQTPEQRAGACREALNTLRQLFALPQREAFFAKAHADIMAWLELDDRGLSIDDFMVCYPNSRISGLFAELKG